MRKPLWTYLACCIAVFMIAMDNLIVTNALPVIREALHTGLEGLEWTVNAYTLTFAVLLLTGAALGDRFGRRRLMIIGITVFTAASAASAARRRQRQPGGSRPAARCHRPAGLGRRLHAVSIRPAPAFLSRPLLLGHDAVEQPARRGIMPTSPITVCALCGLRFSSRPLMEWHVREDHKRRPEPKEPPSGPPPDEEAAPS